ncbi:SEL1-like repeat protein [Polymorphobacter megasporae]|uniref:SEL1-like repeat protein n=1 Tax=Glacieibacterium megasporae TaxID=2835787 RepID=UPI001C1E5F50|nr:SEL1-like repeat protein [Polymorphobacter megasporae]UAJ08649.1 SEL1-like repeat protein [Polymorphobacter megasporae]
MPFLFLLAAAALAASPAPPASTPVATALDAGIDAYRAGNFAAARTQFAALADRDSAVAETMLGTMYARGEGVRSDAATAVTYYYRAAQRGYPPAQLALAQAMAAGKGIAADRDTAWLWARRAQQRGDQRTIAAAAAVAASLAAGRSPTDLAALENRLDGWRPWASGRD